MGEHAVRAAGQNLYIQRLEFIIANGYVRNLSRSNEGEIPGVEAKHYPFSLVIFQCYLSYLTLVKCLSLESRCLFSYQHIKTPLESIMIFIINK